MNAKDRPFLSVAELGDRLGVSRGTAYALVRDGVVPVVQIRGVHRIPAAALETWITERGREALDALR